MSRESMFLGSLSRHNKDLEQWTLKPSAHHSSRVLDKHATALRQISVTAPFYLEDSRRIQDSKRREWRSAWGGREREKERESARTCRQERESERKHFGSSFYMLFSSTWACPMQIELSRECCLFCLFCLKSSLWSSNLPCLLYAAILDSFSLFYIPNIPHSRDGRPNSLGLGASRSFWLVPAELGQ